MIMSFNLRVIIYSKIHSARSARYREFWGWSASNSDHPVLSRHDENFRLCHSLIAQFIVKKRKGGMMITIYKIY